MVVEETRELSASVADPQENEIPILVRVSSPLPQYHESVHEGQHCICSDSPLKKSSFHPYCPTSTFMGMPAGLCSTKDLCRNLKRLQRTGSSRKHNSARLGSSSSETSYGNVTDRSVNLGAGAIVEGIERYPTSSEV